jgi:hypothetical protein
VPCFLPLPASTASQQAAPKAVDEALREAEALLRSIKSEGGNPSMPSSDLGTTDFGYACDENGCVLVVQQESRETAGEAPTVGVLQQRLPPPAAARTHFVS